MEARNGDLQYPAGSGAVVTAVMGLMIAVADFFVLAAMSPAMAAFVGVALLAVTVMLARLMFQDIAAQRSYLLAQQEVSGLTLSVLSNMSKLRAAGGEHRVLSRWGRLQREALRHQMMSRRVETWIMVMASVLMPVVIAMVIAAGSATVEDRTRVVTAILASQLLITNFIQFIYVLQMLFLRSSSSVRFSMLTPSPVKAGHSQGSCLVRSVCMRSVSVMEEMDR